MQRQGMCWQHNGSGRSCMSDWGRRGNCVDSWSSCSTFRFLGAAYSGVGVAVSVVTKITEHVLSSNTMKEAQNIDKKSNEIAEKIQKLFEQLKAERREVSSFADPDDLDRHIMTEILRAMARRSGLDWKINFRMLDDEPQFFFSGPRFMGLNQVYFSTPFGFLGILAFFTFEVNGKEFQFLFAKGAKELIKLLPANAFKTALKGGAKVVGGAVGMAFALPEAIDNWKDMIEKNHATEASQSLRDTADTILKMTQTLRGQFDDMKKMFDDLAKSQQQHEEKLSIEKNTQDCTEKTEEEENDGEEEGSDQKEEENDGEEEGSDQKEEENDGEEEGSDQKEEENDGEEEGSDQEEERDGEEEGSDQEEEESDSKEEESDREETEDDESKQTKRNRKETPNKQRGKSKEVLELCQDQRSNSSTAVEINHELENNPTPPAAIRVALLNLWSMNNKTSRILELITQTNLDVFLSTETFLREDTADRVLREATPSNFNFYYQARASRGGGTAIQFTQALQGQQIHFYFITTFEFVAAVLQHEEWDEPILIVNMCHRPGYNLTQFRAFLDEFQTLLDLLIIVDCNSIIVTGDFNIWVDVENRRAIDEFDWLLLINDLDQHVQEPTHRAGHFLDLVITRNVEIFDLFVLDNGISDHYTVYFNARPVSKDTREKTKESMEQDEQAKRFKKKEE
ncbi:hypothetical protein PFLUV_G00184850 [Perca fluviatilis]|uniref:Endonuclease/exonuclease/phosphatase domain-containing protein n=1 Tax=Perca fluviatilis TaxID=8168 RepID=A0A6A5DXE7_PERFL|nr:hypothetical protein PFLUV_G00184850 [Perca fluviatilis]